MSKRFDPMQAMMRRRQADETEGRQPASDYDRLMEEFKELQSLFEEQKQMLANLQGESLADPVTGLANGRTLETELNRSLATARRHGRTHALVMVEILDFVNLARRLQKPGAKNVGHAMLNHTARLIRQNIRPTDIAARLEDGTFAIIFNELRAASNATERAHAIAAILEHTPCITETSSLHMSVSVGCRVFSGEDNLAAILNDAVADMAMPDGPTT